MNKSEKKAVYAAPKLEVFGSVRNLTGGSSGQESDGGRSQRMLP